jgi:SAM-dependent methyltransferase
MLFPKPSDCWPGSGRREVSEVSLEYDIPAAQYDAQLTSNPYDVLARAAFQNLVVRYVPGGSTLLDFGCGTGLDALQYAQQGYRVLAYDTSPGMMAGLERRCAASIVSGEVIPYSMDYQRFLDSFPQWPAPHAVVSNFAVLNLIPDLEPLFDAFARRLAPPGWVIFSVLNPIHWSKVRMPEWWRGLWKTDSGSPIFTAQPHTSYLHFLPRLLRAAPQFQMVGRANAGKLVRYDSAIPSRERLWWGQQAGVDPLQRALWHSPAYKLLGHFLFLVMRRDR